MSRGRPEGPNVEKLMKIMSILQANPQGLWARLLVRQTGLSTGTVYYYLEHYLEPFIDNIGVRDSEGKFVGIRMIRLKEGVTIADVLRRYKVRKELRES